MVARMHHRWKLVDMRFMLTKRLISRSLTSYLFRPSFATPLRPHCNSSMRLMGTKSAQKTTSNGVNNVTSPPPFETLALYPDWYKKLNCKPSPIHSALLEAFSECDYHLINSEGECVNGAAEHSHVGVISFNNTFPVISSFAPHLIYVRPFYSDLLAAIRGATFGHVVLLGNPGISKSFFQLYYLARILNPDKFGALPPDHLKSTALPKIVIRQVGNSEMYIYDIEHRRAERYSGISKDVLDCFDPATSIYMMEPGGSGEQPCFEMVTKPILLTVSPNELRYKEFVKSGADVLYMPTYELDELLAIGAYLLKNGDVPKDLISLYSAESLRERFEQFGGIMRHVLPLSMDALSVAISNQKTAIEDADCSKLLQRNIQERLPQSHYLLRYVVQKDGVNAFSDPGQEFINSNIIDRLKDKLMRLSFDDKVACLQRNDECPNHMTDICPKLLGDVIAELLCGGIKWKRRLVQRIDMTKKKQAGETLPLSDWEEFEEKVNEVHEGDYPKYEEMRPNILYKPMNIVFPFCEFFYRSDDGKLVVFQLTRRQSERKIVTLSALQKFLVRVGIDVNNAADKIRLVYIPKQRNAGKAYLQEELGTKRDEEAEIAQVKHDESKLLAVLATYEVWAIPAEYKAKFAENEVTEVINLKKFEVVELLVTNY